MDRNATTWMFLKGHTKTPTSAFVSTSPTIGGVLIQKCGLLWQVRWRVNSSMSSWSFQSLHEIFKAKSLLSIVLLRHCFIMLKKFFITSGYEEIGLCNLGPHFCTIYFTKRNKKRDVTILEKLKNGRWGLKTTNESCRWLSLCSISSNQVMIDFRQSTIISVRHEELFEVENWNVYVWGHFSN